MKQHTKAPHTADGTQISVDEMEEMAFQEHQLMEVDNEAGVYRYVDNGGVHYVAAMRTEFPVDSTSYTLPDGRTVIGKDAYEAEMVKAVFER
jgi:hypothetical protein